MPLKINTLYIKTKGITGRPVPSSQTTHPDLAAWQRRYDTTDTSQYKGKRVHTLYGQSKTTPYHKQKEAIIEGVRKRIDASILKARPDYVAKPSTMTQRGDKLSGYRCQLLVAVAWLVDAIANKRRSPRESAFYAINTHYLAIMRELYGADTIYKDHENVGCTDHFICEKERFYGKRRKNKA
tara:strand:- start:1045 stop:1590 length:546 start_codon:yes stop_codon:yes gene_type:complete